MFLRQTSFHGVPESRWMAVVTNEVLIAKKAKAAKVMLTPALRFHWPR